MKKCIQETNREKMAMWVHITLIKDDQGGKVTHKGNKLLIPLVRAAVLVPKKSAMVVPCFRLSKLSIQYISSVYQISEIFTSVSARQNGKYSVKMVNVSKEARMINQKLAMVGVQLVEGTKVT